MRAVARVLVARVSHDAADMDALGRLVARVSDDAERTRRRSDFAGLALRHRLWETLADTKAQVRGRVGGFVGARVRACMRSCVMWFAPVFAALAG